MRKVTIELIERGESDSSFWEVLARACLEVLSEYQVKDMAEDEGFIDCEEEEGEDDE